MSILVADREERRLMTRVQGDWKLSALSLTTPLSQQDGSATRYTYPEIDSRLPPQVQWKLDYLGMTVSTFMPMKRLTSLCVCYSPRVRSGFHDDPSQ